MTILRSRLQDLIKGLKKVSEIEIDTCQYRPRYSMGNNRRNEKDSKKGREE